MYVTVPRFFGAAVLDLPFESPDGQRLYYTREKATSGLWSGRVRRNQGPGLGWFPRFHGPAGQHRLSPAAIERDRAAPANAGQRRGCGDQLDRAAARDRARRHAGWTLRHLLADRSGGQRLAASRG